MWKFYNDASPDHLIHSLLNFASVKTATWAGDCFIYTNTTQRLKYFVGGQTYNIAQFSSDMFLLGYIPRDSRIYLADKDLNIISYSLPLAVIEYQLAILRRDFGAASKLLPSVPNQLRSNISEFLEAEGE